MAGSLYRCAILTVCSLAVWGCGGSSGGGNTGGGGSDHDPIKVTVPGTVIEYGDRVTVSWSGKDLLTMDTDRVSGTNFAIGREQTSGSISDRPAADTTYRIEGLTKSDRPAKGEVTVRVRKSSKSFLIVGSETDPLVPEIVQELSLIHI